MKLLLYISLIFLLLLLLPAAPSSAQVECDTFAATDPDADTVWSLHFGAQFSIYPNYVAGDFYGYSVLYAGGQGTVVIDLGAGTVYSSSTSFNYLVNVHTEAMSVYRVGGTFDGQICTPVGGTPTYTPTITLTPSNTPTPTITLTPSNTPTMTLTPSNTPTVTETPTNTPFPTSSPTLTPTEVLVTATFTPTPTIDNVAVLVERTNQSFQFNVFLAIPLLGILLLLLLRRR